MKYKHTLLNTSGLIDADVVSINNKSHVLVNFLSKNLESSFTILSKAKDQVEVSTNQNLMAMHMNDHDDVVGISSVNNNQRAFVCVSGELSILKEAIAPSSANFINNGKRIVGSYSPSGEWSGLFTCEFTEFQERAKFPYAYVTPRFIDENGRIVGCYQTGENYEYQPHAFFYDSNALFEDINPDNSISSDGVSIDINGNILINSEGEKYSKSYIYNYGEYYDIGHLEGFKSTQSLSMNENGIVIGHCSRDEIFDEFGEVEPFVYVDGAMVFINNVLEENYIIDRVIAINKFGEIVAKIKAEGGSRFAILEKV